MCVIKLGAMIGHKLMGYSDLADDILPNEVSHVLLINVCQWFSFHPFHIVFNYDYDIFELPMSLGERTNEVNSAFGEGLVTKVRPLGG